MISGAWDRRIIAASFVRVLLYIRKIRCIVEYIKFMRDVYGGEGGGRGAGGLGNPDRKLQNFGSESGLR
jgi:hypothetical protein